MIDEAALREAFAALQARVAALEIMTGLFVADAALDLRGGNVKIHFDPRDWRGQSQKGRFAKDCSPEFLEAYAAALSWMADHPKETTPDALKKASYNRLDSARCRAWARRLRRTAAAETKAPVSDTKGAPSGTNAPADETPDDDLGDDLDLGGDDPDAGDDLNDEEGFDT